jgi:hypothetical protein
MRWQNPCEFLDSNGTDHAFRSTCRRGDARSLTGMSVMRLFAIILGAILSGLPAYAMFTSADGQNWGEPSDTGTFPQNAGLHTVKFTQPAAARCLKLVAKCSFNSSVPYAALAELNIIPGDH